MASQQPGNVSEQASSIRWEKRTKAVEGVKSVKIMPGTGQFIAQARDKGRSGKSAGSGNGGYTLNFEGTQMREIVRAVLGDILKLNYTIDERLASVPVYMQTASPLDRKDLLPTLETLLGNYGAIIVREGNVYNVVPKSVGLSSVLNMRTRVTQGGGFQNIVVPLRFISAEEMRKILTAIHKPRNGVSVDAHRNLLVLRGTQHELAGYLHTIEIFDIDQMAGMSVGLFPLESVDVKTARHEIESILGAIAGKSGKQMVKLIDIERMNSLLAITPQPKYLGDVREWVRRLDHAERTGGKSMYVYFVQNGSAKKLADVLQRLTVNGKASIEASPTEATMPEQNTPPVDNLGSPAPDAKGVPLAVAAGLNKGSGGVARLNGLSDVRFIADEDRNALVILATPEQYAQVRRVLKELDVAPNQVLVQASIIEVTLKNEFNFGLEWYFRQKGAGRTGTAQLDLGATGVAAIVPGFSYSIVDSADRISAALNALASDTHLRVISSPSLMVLDNKTATITVGDQVPIRTSETVSQATSGQAPVITSAIQFRDTGVTLEVTPRINNSGKVILDIRQEVSSVDRTTTSSIDSPTINKREIKTSVAVASGDTIVLGGLIQDDNQHSNSGLPGARDVPVLGWLFGSESKSKKRTELLVLITPTAVLDDSDARDATSELMKKMKGLRGVRSSF
ncbi:type II secretion system secretin GspD [Alcanivorax sp.]|uniref:type II secretion system secretin GspD n=1 Tax=Alcanivorax sp. TaxID=1872427 RepID=UPI0025880F78|nr:type II secretion system secretin GspD [Alcanivorax sp.]